MFNSKTFSSDFTASFVVFLVALPLCMGIALASGVPAEKGLITGIVGGLIVGFIAGSPLQVSGPAAGLVVLVWEIVESIGLEGLGAVVLMAGCLQLIAGYFGMGRIFRAVSPSVIYGMLSGIGVLIFSSQFHVMIDELPKSSGLENLFAIPDSFFKVFMYSLASHHIPALIGLLTIVIVVSWDKYHPKKLKMIPGALLGITIASLVASLFQLEINYLAIPDSILSTLEPISFSALENIFNGKTAIMVVSMALVASAETLLCAGAVDKLSAGGPKTNYDKELMSQGVGNVICGVFAALPMTGVIVRSSANVEAGAKTRLSAILHGVWLLAFVALIPSLLTFIPTSSLAALLVFIGYKLMNIKILKELRAKGNEELLIFLLTVTSIISFDLLTGIGIGLAATFFQIFYRVTHLEIDLHPGEGKNEYVLDLAGAATFLSIPKLADTLESLPSDAELHVHFRHLSYIDHACLELLTDWGDQHKIAGGVVYLEWDALHHYREPQVRVGPIQESEINLIGTNSQEKDKRNGSSETVRST